MPCELVVDDVAGILHARYSGEVTLDHRLDISLQVVDRLERERIHRVLLDFRSAQSFGNDPDGCRRIVEACLPRLDPRVRLAYLLNYDHQVDPSVESLVRQLGINARRFQDRERAMAWLAEPDAPVPAGAEGTDTDVSPVARSIRLVAEVVGPEAATNPDQFAALGELVHDLLATGMDEAKVRQVAGRLSEAMRQRGE